MHWCMDFTQNLSLDSRHYFRTNTWLASGGNIYWKHLETLFSGVWTHCVSCTLLTQKKRYLELEEGHVSAQPKLSKLDRPVLCLRHQAYRNKNQRSALRPGRALSVSPSGAERRQWIPLRWSSLSEASDTNRRVTASHRSVESQRLK